MNKFKCNVMITKLWIAILLCGFATSLYAQTHLSTQPHEGAITAVATTSVGGKKVVFTGGDDGFLIRWTEDGKGEHLQISDDKIKMIAVHPNGNDVAVYETDGFSVNRLSVWNWQTKSLRFSAKRLESAVTSLEYSAKGTQLMIGQSNITGIIFMNSTRGTVISGRVKDTVTGITFAQTSTSENTAIMYSSLGYLIYTNLQTGVRKASFKIESNLEYPVLFNNDVLFAGVKGNRIYLYEATTGTLVQTIAADNPILCTAKSDSNLFYFETNGRNSVLKTVEVQDGYVQSAPTQIKQFSFQSWDNPTAVSKHEDSVYIGMASGELYAVDTFAASQSVAAVKISEQEYGKIYDIAEHNNNLYFLSADNVLESSYTQKRVDILVPNNGHTNMIVSDDFVILWSKSTRKSVTYVSRETKVAHVLFTPENSIEMMRLNDNKLLFLEGSSKISYYDFDAKNVSLIYTGTGIQDALLYKDSVYVAKTAVTTPRSPLIQVNINTKETIVIDMEGDVAFSLSESAVGTAPFYGASIVSSSGNNTTKIFSYNSDTKTYAAILTLGDEDTNAFTYVKNGVLFTNIGKTQIYSLTLSQKRLVKMDQSASLPMKIVGNQSVLAVLNKNGSISWFNASDKKLLKNWYITLENTWVEV